MKDDLPLNSDERSDHGYVIILPGIEGHSFLNRSIVKGLLDAEIPYAIEIHDWTAGWLRMLHNLRSQRRHREQSQILVEKLLNYQDKYPGRPTYLIGHSGGGAMILNVLESLPDSRSITGAILLGAAAPPQKDLALALKHIDQHLWNVSSWGDFLIIGLLTGIFGRLGGSHGFCAGMVGFAPTSLSEKLIQMPYQRKFLLNRNFAGHFGYTARPFVRQWLAPLISPVKNTAQPSLGDG